MLQICLRCGQVRESDISLACVRPNHAEPFPMTEMTETTTWLGSPPHPLYGRTGADPKLRYLRDLGPESVVVASKVTP